MIEFTINRKKTTGNTKIITREAVRAVIYRENCLLMIHSPREGDYKFPGGGKEKEESHRETIIREVKEECGADIVTVGRQIGKACELRSARERGSTFCMNSHYYLCTVQEGEFSEQKLDDYERELQFEPVWITPEKALEENWKVLKKSDHAPWVERETKFLKELLSED